ncbi:MAG: LysM peptidoglycan-binding domain-containing protein [Anaerolineaceae bacterium]|nr:LysM peptidoglycan-binding domain-containing protein [Anaerolineaceae bacterium]
MLQRRLNNRKILFTLVLFTIIMMACVRSGVAAPLPAAEIKRDGEATLPPPLPTQVRLNTMIPLNLPTRLPGSTQVEPTPDFPRVLPTLRSEPLLHIVQPGETLGNIAKNSGVLWSQIAEENQILDPNLLSIGQNLLIPPPQPSGKGSSYKVIPDSELVFGPASVLLDLPSFVRAQNGYLLTYKEELLDTPVSGSEVIARVSREFSINPRLLLAILEHQSGWITRKNPAAETLDYPIGYKDVNRQGLYRQLIWAANNLNRGYYLWKANAISYWTLSDGNVILADPTINAGTAALQYQMSQMLDRPAWEYFISSNGLALTYQKLFGSPFDFAIEPAFPDELQQPLLLLPFEVGKTWSFTGGPHGGWGDGSAWAGLDFAPPGNALGCVPSDEWVTAVADGLIIHSAEGVVVLDLDGDGYEQTGWTILYLHIESRGRTPVGTWVKTGEKIGHPSCEGGLSNGTHVHIARRYNGEWVSADGSLPFNLSGWISEGTGNEYDGYLVKNGQIIEAWDSRKLENQITR